MAQSPKQSGKPAASKHDANKPPRVLEAAQPAPAHPAPPAPTEEPKPMAATNGASGKVRNRRAEITDHLPTDEQLAPIANECKKAWDHIVKQLHTAGLKVGTTFKTPDGESFSASVLDYPFVSVLRLAQSRQHNKLMDGYSDPSEPVIPTVREIDAELVKGSWSQRGEGGTRFTLLDRAIAAIYGVEPATAKETLIPRILAEMKLDEKELRKNPDVAARMNEIKLSDAQARVAASKSAAASSTVKLPSFN